MIETIKQELEFSRKTLELFISDKNSVNAIERAAEKMIESLNNGGKLISCGNGGSMCDAMHFAEELSGRFRNDRKGLAAVSISDPSHITCVGNDYGFDQIFSRYIHALGRKGDCLLAISTSGNSKNVLLAANEAKQMGITVIALTGKDGGELGKIADVEIRAPRSEFSDRVQEIHIKVIHILIHLIEKGLSLS